MIMQLENKYNEDEDEDEYSDDDEEEEEEDKDADEQNDARKDAEMEELERELTDLRHQEQ